MDKKNKSSTTIIKQTFSYGKSKTVTVEVIKKKDGLNRYWYMSGKLQTKGYYKDGKRFGLWKGWYGNGQLKTEIKFKDGKSISEKCWGEDGNEIESCCNATLSEISYKKNIYLH